MFTQDKSKDGQKVLMPINESAIMKAHLAEWIRERVTIMNKINRKKVVLCWEKTGLLAIWDANERLFWCHKLLLKLHVSFPATIMMIIVVWLIRLTQE
jgi:hypothetical protein